LLLGLDNHRQKPQKPTAGLRGCVLEKCEWKGDVSN
jgi:hypothetical protein